MGQTGVSGTGAPSRTAMMAACARGGHLLNYGPDAVLFDWLAWPLIGGEAEAMTNGLRDAFAEVSIRVANWPKLFGALATAEGEPLVSLFTPDEFAALLNDNGFDVVEDVGAEDIEARFGPQAIATAEERIALARSR